ncbi:MAG TPA: class I SAM-dependent methyltransferase [Allosphingosinicella sp.]|nr:class I SAM-dependent methyltransferase [Allosphingosinicella sp.]
MELTRREALAAAFLPLLAGAAEPEYDVPYVPTPPALVEAMLDLADVTQGDYLIDLGCGDGRIALAAARRGARALGVDIDPVRIESANFALQLAGLAPGQVRFRRQDLFATPIREANVIALYLLPSINLALRPRLLTELRPGARIVSHAFDMGEWRAEAEERHDGRRILLWIVPAVAGGSWALTEADGTQWTLELDQRFQDVTGTMSGQGRAVEIEEGRIRGTGFAFTAGGRRFEGRIEDAEIVGEGWRAVRLS